jgi:DNA-binding protein H-NS
MCKKNALLLNSRLNLLAVIKKNIKNINALILLLRKCVQKRKEERKEAKEKIKCLKERLNSIELQLLHRPSLDDIESAAKFFKIGKGR